MQRTLRFLAAVILGWAGSLLATPPVLGEEEEALPFGASGKSASGDSQNAMVPAAPADADRPLLLDLFDFEGLADRFDFDSDAPPATWTPEPVCDVIEVYLRRDARRDTASPRRVRLIPWFLTLPLKPSAEYEFASYLGNDEGRLILRVAGEQVTGIDYYEHRVLRRCAALLEAEPNELAAANRRFDLDNPERLADALAAEVLLRIALKEHDSAVQRQLRRGGEWKAICRDPLQRGLDNVLFTQLETLIAQERHAQAEIACDRLAELPGFAGKLRPYYEQVLLSPAHADLEAERYAEARTRLLQFMERYPLNPGDSAMRLRQDLIARAKAALAGISPDATTAKSLRLIDEAELIWPDLPELDRLRRQSVGKHPVLYCAYVQLPRPERISPLSARTPVERHVAGLLFEPLVRWTDDPMIGGHYAPQLLRGRPLPLAKGRRFHLPAVEWSDSQVARPHLLLAEDAQTTVKLMRIYHPPGFAAKWSELIAGVDVGGKQDPWTATIRLARDLWQPLSAMDFMVLPADRFPADAVNLLALSPEERESLPDEARQALPRLLREARAKLDRARSDFERNPVGAGPYVAQPHEERVGDFSQDRLRLTANPHYRHAARLPIREMVLRRMDLLEAIDELEQGTVHCIYGLGREHVTQLSQRGLKVERLRNRSVYFLAPNHRRKELRNADLRLAIAHAIDRSEILGKIFRPGGRSADHAELTGPFPRYDVHGETTWAYNPQTQDYDVSLAAGLLSQARKAQAGLLPAVSRTFTLLYPANDSDAEAAVNEIRLDLAAIGLTLELIALEEDDFYERVVVEHEFDLAYWRHDFHDATYWLWPLLDHEDAAPGGANFMGVPFDETLHRLLADQTRHKRFSHIRRLAHDLHQHVHNTAVLIPLWQLDTYVAVHPAVEHPPLDPGNFFGDITAWRLKPQR